MTGMMSIRQLVMYRVLMCGLTASWNGTLEAIASWKEEPTRRLQTTTRSFRFYFGKLLQRIPDSFLSKDPRKNKLEIKKWIYSNIPWDEKWKELGEATIELDDSENEEY